MRLLLINYEYPPVGAGAGNATLNLARALVSLGHCPIVLTAAFAALPARSDADGIIVIRVPAKRVSADRSSLFEMATYVASCAFALPKVIREEKPNAAIVFFSMPCGPLGLLGRWLAGIPYIISLRGGDVPGTESSLARMYTLMAPLRRLVLARAAAVVANSEGLKLLSQAADSFKVEVIPNGVDTEFFRPPQFRQERPFTFLFVGRFQHQKNLAFLLSAISELRRQTVAPFRVVLVGDGPLRQALINQAGALGLDDIVAWRGWCGKVELLKHYQGADCFLNPSLYEGMPNTVLEAMACGLPVLASNVPGNDAVVRSAKTGFLFELNDLSQVVASMVRVLGEPEMISSLGRAARALVVTDFSWKDVAQRHIHLLDEPERAV